MDITPIWRHRNSIDIKSESSDGFEIYPELFVRLLKSRGFDNKNKIDEFLSAKLNQLKDPYLLNGMEKAVQRLVQAFVEQEKICIYADFDLDGTSGLALLIKALKDFGYKDVIHYQPKRLSEGYGFHASAVEDLSKSGVNLIVTVDVGITAYEACIKAKDLNIDVIITDHHLPKENLPLAYVIVNPNTSEDHSGLGYLSGAGVAFYLVRALYRELVNKKIVEKNYDLKELLDCFTIATLTDMVPVVEDNRILVKHGLLKLAETSRPGLKYLLQKLDLLGRPLSSQDVAIRFAPKLNALSRMEMGILPLDIYLIEDDFEASKIVSSVIENNLKRVEFQGNAEKEALELISQQEDKNFTLLVSPNFHRGVVGLIATKMSQLTNKPCFIGSLGEDGQVVGSARQPNGYVGSLVEALEYCKDALHRAGGHAAAAGFEFNIQNIKSFRRLLEEYYEQQVKNTFEYFVDYDIEAQLHEINPTLMAWYDHFGPFGVSFPTPVFLLRNIYIDEIRNLRGGHVKLSLRCQLANKNIDALLFSPSPSQVEIAQPGSVLDLLVELQWNYYNGRKTVQLLVKDLRNL